jgi:hypothetical protein
MSRDGKGIRVETDRDFEAAKGVLGPVEHVVPIEVTLRFRVAQAEETVHSLEGPTVANPGDYVMTGTIGEHYIVAAHRFASKYKDVDMTSPTEGRATKMVDGVVREAVRASKAFEAKTWNGVIQGEPGDVLLRYGEGDFGIVAKKLFDTLYRVESGARGRG